MNLDVSLSNDLADFIKAKVSTGRFASSSEVVRGALRLMEKIKQQDVEKLGALRTAWTDGTDSGDAGEIHFAALNLGARPTRAG